jgi:hypothetical protein
MWLTTDVRRATMIDGCGGPPPEDDVSADGFVLAD